MQTLTISASVRPRRVAILCDIADPEWMRSCRHILEIFSTLWGGHGNIIIPTDGCTIQPIFWRILEAFDPDHIYKYRPSFRDLEERDPQAFEQIVAEKIRGLSRGNQPTSREIDRVRKALRNEDNSKFAVTSELAQELKARIAPFFFEDYIVGPDTWKAGEVPGFPHTRILDIISKTDQADRIILPARLLPPAESLWYSATLGTCEVEFEHQLRESGITPLPFGDGSRTQDAMYEQRNLVSYAVERDSLEWYSTLNVAKPNTTPSDTLRLTPADLSLTNLGWFRQKQSKLWAPKAIAIAGNTISDFCLYLALKRMRERVFWIFPPITEAALAGASVNYQNSPSGAFAHSLRRVALYVQQHPVGVDFLSASLSQSQVNGVKNEIARATEDPTFGGVFGLLANAIPGHPLRYLEKSNASKLSVEQVPDTRIIELFETPKPTSFRHINPSKHRWITELELKAQQPPRHPALGNWYLTGANQGTDEVRTSGRGLAYTCPSSIIFNGQDVDAVTVRPNIRVPEALEIFEKLAEWGGLTCSISDKGLYAQDANAKLGGLDKAGQFFRSEPGCALVAAYLDKAPNKKGQYSRGVYIESDERRYLSAADLVRALKTVKQAVSFIDDFAAKGILYRGYIFHCEFCRNSAWYPLKDISDRFSCPRCHREQVYTSKHWKKPRAQPSVYYQLDEIVYQGFFNDMHVPTLALDSLRRSAEGSFLYVEELEFREKEEAKPLIECDINCVMDGVLTIGEAKKAAKLNNKRAEEIRTIEKYKDLATKLGARRIVFATLAEQWDAATQQEILKRLDGSFDLWLLTGANLMKA